MFKKEDRFVKYNQFYMTQQFLCTHQETKHLDKGCQTDSEKKKIFNIVVDDGKQIVVERPDDHEWDLHCPPSGDFMDDKCIVQYDTFANKLTIDWAKEA